MHGHRKLKPLEYYVLPDVSAERSAYETSVTVRDYRLPPRRKLDLRSSGMLSIVDWWLPTFRSHLLFVLLGCYVA